MAECKSSLQLMHTQIRLSVFEAHITHQLQSVLLRIVKCGIAIRVTLNFQYEWTKLVYLSYIVGYETAALCADLNSLIYVVLINNDTTISLLSTYNRLSLG